MKIGLYGSYFLYVDIQFTYPKELFMDDFTERVRK